MPLLPNDSCGTAASDATNWRNVLRPTHNSPHINAFEDK